MPEYIIYATRSDEVRDIEVVGALGWALSECQVQKQNHCRARVQ